MLPVLADLVEQRREDAGEHQQACDQGSAPQGSQQAQQGRARVLADEGGQAKDGQRKQDADEELREVGRAGQRHGGPDGSNAGGGLAQANDQQSTKRHEEAGQQVQMRRVQVVEVGKGESDGRDDRHTDAEAQGTKGEIGKKKEERVAQPDQNVEGVDGVQGMVSTEQLNQQGDRNKARHERVFRQVCADRVVEALALEGVFRVHD